MMEEIQKKEKKVLAVGALVLDIIPIFEELTSEKERTSPGGTIYLKRIDTAIGGSVGNTGLTLHRLGAQTTVFSKIGGDSLGTLVDDEMKKSNCKYYILKDIKMNTSISVIVAKPGQDRMILHNRGASQNYDSQDIPEELLKENDLMHFGYPTGMKCMYSDNGKTLSEFYKRAKEYGLTTSMDLSFPGIYTPAGMADWYSILKKTLPYVDIFLPSFEELLLILRREEYLSLKKEYPEMKMDDIFSQERVSSMAAELLELGVRIVAIKCGEKGAYVRTGKEETIKKIGRAADLNTEQWAEKELFAPPFQIDRMISTNGAGDSFVAGFLQGILLGKDAVHTLQFASAVAAIRIMSVDGRGGIPDYQKVDNVIANKLKWTDLEMEYQYWKQDFKTGVYEHKKEGKKNDF